MRRQIRQGPELSLRPCPRITSYNVCYTKLLRCLAFGAPAEAGVRGAVADWIARAQSEGTVEREIAVGGTTRSYRLHSYNFV